MVILHKGNKIITLFYLKFVYKTSLGDPGSLYSPVFFSLLSVSVQTLHLIRTRMRKQGLCSSLITSQEWSRYICVLLLGRHF